MMKKPENWARGDISQDHSKSSAFAHGYREGWDAAVAAAREAALRYVAEPYNAAAALAAIFQPTDEGAE